MTIGVLVPSNLILTPSPANQMGLPRLSEPRPELHLTGPLWQLMQDRHLLTSTGACGDHCSAKRCLKLHVQFTRRGCFLEHSAKAIAECSMKRKKRTVCVLHLAKRHVGPLNLDVDGTLQSKVWSQHRICHRARETPTIRNANTWNTSS